MTTEPEIEITKASSMEDKSKFLATIGLFFTEEDLITNSLKPKRVEKLTTDERVRLLELKLENLRKRYDSLKKLKNVDTP